MLLKSINASASRIILGATCLFLLGSAAQAQVSIVAVGDSNIRGKGLLENDAYPAKLERALRAKGHNVTVKNAGINGDTTKGVLARLDSSVPQGTQIAIVGVGVNDVVQGFDRSTAAANITSIVRRLRERNIQVLLFSAAGTGAPQRRTELEALGVVVTPPIQDGIADDPTFHIETVKTPGNYHLNSAGYDIVVTRTLPLVEGLIAKVK